MRNSIELDPSELLPLLQHVREYADMSNAPEGLKKCRDCSLLQELLDSDEKIRNEEDTLRRQQDAYFKKLVYPKLLAQRKQALEAWSSWDEEQMLDQAATSSDGVPADWDF